MIRFEPQHFKEIEDYIWEFSGILLERVPKKGVTERIKKHIEGVGVTNVADYLGLLKSPAMVPIRDQLISQITVNESYFFRNPAHFRYLAHELLPALFEQKLKLNLKQISMWSAGCATGEEAYSLAYVTTWFKRKHAGVRLHILGTDINMCCIEKARKGEFRKRSFRPNSQIILDELKESLGVEKNEIFQVDPLIRDEVLFKYFNLKELASIRTMNKMDMIFCRNVLIYFDDTFRMELIQSFYEVLNPGGYLFLGETESLPHGQTLFELKNCNGAFCYRKSSHQGQGK
jgi:chemotaxis protein methyltransferase CheR